MKPAIKRLSQEDARHLRALEDWLELGDLVSASDELEETAAAQRAHPAVVKVSISVEVINAALPP